MAEEKKKLAEERKRLEEEKKRLEEERKKHERMMNGTKNQNRNGGRSQSTTKKITVYCTWGKLIPFQFNTTCQLSTVFDIMFKKIIPHENRDEYYLVDNSDPYEVLPLNASLNDMGFTEGTVFARTP